MLGVWMDVDREALRQAVGWPTLTTSYQLDALLFDREIAQAELTELNPQLLRQPKDPELLFRIAELYRRMNDDNQLEFYRRAREALLAIDSRTEGQQELLVRACLHLSAFDDANAQSKRLVTEPTKAILRWEIEHRQWSQGVFPRGRSDLLLAEEAPDRAKLTEALGTLANRRTQVEAIAKRFPDHLIVRRLLRQLWADRDHIAFVLNAESKPSELVSTEQLAQLKEIARLSPGSVADQVLPFAYRFLRELDGQRGLAEISGGFSEETRAWLDELSSRVGQVAASGASGRSVALEAQSLMLAFRQRLPEAINLLRPLAESEPGHPRRGPSFLEMLVTAESYREAAEFAVKLGAVRRDDPSRQRWAMSLDALGDRRGAERVINEGLMAAGDSSRLKLAKAALLLRDGSGAGISDAGTILDALALEPERLGPVARQDLLFLRAIRQGLLGERAEARRLLLSLAGSSKPAGRLKRALDALGSSQLFGRVLSSKG